MKKIYVIYEVRDWVPSIICAYEKENDAMNRLRQMYTEKQPYSKWLNARHRNFHYRLSIKTTTVNLVDVPLCE